MDEYILGKAKKSSFGDTSEEKEEREDGEEEGEKRKVCSQYLCSFFSLLGNKKFSSCLMYVFGDQLMVHVKTLIIEEYYY